MSSGGAADEAAQMLVESAAKMKGGTAHALRELCTPLDSLYLIRDVLCQLCPARAMHCVSDDALHE